METDSGRLTFDFESLVGFQEFRAFKERLLSDDSCLSRAQKEMIAAVVSAINGSRMCVVAHAKSAAEHSQNAGLFDSLIDAGEGAATSDADRAMLEYVARITRTPGEVTTGLRQLREHGFDDKAIAEMIMVAGMTGMANRVRLVSLGEVAERMAEMAMRAMGDPARLAGAEK